MQNSKQTIHEWTWIELANKKIRQFKPDLCQMGEQEPPLNLGLLHGPPFVSPLIRNALNKSDSAVFNALVASLPFVDTALAWWAAAGQIYCQAPLSLQLLKINILRRWRLWLGLCFGLTCKVWDLFWGMQIALEIFGKTSQCLNIKEFHLRIWSSSDGSFGTASTAWTWQCLPFCCVFQGFGHPDEVLAPSKKSLSRSNLVTRIIWLVISLLGYLPCTHGPGVGLPDYCSDINTRRATWQQMFHWIRKMRQLEAEVGGGRTTESIAREKKVQIKTALQIKRESRF